MAAKNINTLKLGIFVIAGLAFLVILLYMIGKNQNLFGKTFMLKARFENVHGLTPGNNIRFAGIDAGTVKSVEVLNDTTIEVKMLIKTRMREYIHKNAVATIGTDGLMGNKLINITSAREPAPTVAEGDILYSMPATDTEEMMNLLNRTNQDLAEIASELKASVKKFNKSNALWTLLEDQSLPVNLRQSLTNFRNSTEELQTAMVALNQITRDIQNGKGSIGVLLKDTSISGNVFEAVEKIKTAAAGADSLMVKVNGLAATITQDVNSGSGSLHAILKDEKMKESLFNDLKNIEEGTRRFNEVMDAVKNSFLFRGYFRKQAAKSSETKY